MSETIPDELISEFEETQPVDEETHATLRSFAKWLVQEGLIVADEGAVRLDDLPEKWRDEAEQLNGVLVGQAHREKELRACADELESVLNSVRDDAQEADS